MTKTLYAISDLHLGGAFREGWPGAGSRLCGRPDRLAAFLAECVATDEDARELIVHGDVFDFLAEDLREHQSVLDPGATSEGDAAYWVPFIDDENVAAEVARSITGRKRDGGRDDQAVFDALVALRSRGVAITILLGNHDLELAYPAVQAVFEQRLRVERGAPLKWELDGAPYCPDAEGHVAILHGNEADDFNRVDYRTLTQRRGSFMAPPGSRLVASVMNPIKTDWPFVDLLKPEITATVPLLLWLAPSTRDQLGEVARLFLAAKGIGLGDWVHPQSRVAAHPLEALLTQALGEPELYAQPRGGRAAIGWIELLLSDRDVAFEERDLGPLRRALSAITSRFGQPPDAAPAALSSEPDRSLRKLVEDTWRNGARVIVAGHTHLARNIKEDGHQYLNTGTWADVLPLDPGISTWPDERLRRWLGDLRRPGPHWDDLVDQRRYYARIELGDDRKLRKATLENF